MAMIMGRGVVSVEVPARTCWPGKANHEANIMESHDLVTIYTLANPVTAEIIKNAL
jgi:hypothetical protein